MGLYNKDDVIELRVLGPEGKPFVDLESEFRPIFQAEGYQFMVPRLFSAPELTEVALTIGGAVLTGVTIHTLNALIDKLLNIKKARDQKQTRITVSVHIGDNYIVLPESKEEMIKKLDEIKRNNVNH